MIASVAPSDEPPLVMGQWLTVAQPALDRLKRDIAAHGFGCIERAIAPVVLADMRAEAAEAAGAAKQAIQEEGLSYRARIGSFGRNTAAFLASDEVRSLLLAMFGSLFVLAEDVSCITFYAPDDHLGPHLDEPAERCAVTILIYLHAESPEPDSIDSGLNLRIYGEALTPGSAPATLIPTRAGAIVLGRGSRFWHERPPLRPGEQVIAITGCYAPVENAPGPA